MKLASTAFNAYHRPRLKVVSRPATSLLEFYLFVLRRHMHRSSHATWMRHSRLVLALAVNIGTKPPAQSACATYQLGCKSTSMAETKARIEEQLYGFLQLRLMRLRGKRRRSSITSKRRNNAAMVAEAQRLGRTTLWKVDALTIASGQKQPKSNKS